MSSTLVFHVTNSASSTLATSTSIKAFGATGDGVTDDTAAISDALNYAQTNGVRLVGDIGDKYLITADIPLIREGKEVLDIDLNSSTLLFQNAGRITLALNSPFLTTQLTAEVSRFDKKLSLSSVTGIEVGDIVHINSPAYSNTASGAERLYTLHYYVVNSIIGNDVYIQGGAVADIKVSQIVASIGSGSLASFTVTVRRPTPDVFIKNGYIEVNDPTATSVLARLDLNGCRLSSIENLHVKGHSRIQIYQRNSAYTFAKDCTFREAGYISDDANYTAPGSNSYGYGILSERNWHSVVQNCHGTLCWHVFDVTEGQMHIDYIDCSGERCTPAFSTHSNSWHVNWTRCKAIGGGGFSGFRCHYPSLKDCKTIGLNTEAFNYAPCCVEVKIEGCDFGSNYSGPYTTLIKASSAGNPKLVAPGAISTATPVNYILKDSRLSADGLKFVWTFGIDDANLDSLMVVDNVTFHNLSGYASTEIFSRLHPKTTFRRCKVTGDQGSQFLVQISAGQAHPAGSVINFIDNELAQASIALANNALLYLVTPSSNITYNFIGNKQLLNDNLIRVNTGGTLNIAKLEGNNCTGKLFSKNDASATTINVTSSINNVYNTVSTNLTGITITKSAQNVDRALI